MVVRRSSVVALPPTGGTCEETGSMPRPETAMSVALAEAVSGPDSSISRVLALRTPPAT